MRHGFFTVEQWVSKNRKWKPVLHLDAFQSLNKAIAELKHFGKPGLFRVIQTQRCIWAQIEDGNVRLHGSHVSSPESLAELTKLFKQEKGHRPIENARQERARAKRSRLG